MASQISFYILSPQKKQLAFVCQLIQTVLDKSDDSIIVLAASEQLPSLDDRLWSLSDVSFIPHQIIQQVEAFNHQKIPASVVLTDNVELVTQFDGIVINLTTEPILTSNASRLLEVIDANPDHIESGRRKYRDYQAYLQTYLQANLQASSTTLPSAVTPTINVFQIQ